MLVEGRPCQYGDVMASTAHSSAPLGQCRDVLSGAAGILGCSRCTLLQWYVSPAG